MRRSEESQTRFDLEEIKARVSIQDILAEQGISLKKNRCCCPLHGGKNPSSFCVNNGFFYCHSCGKGGNIFTLVQKLYNLDFRDAVTYLSSKAGIVLPESQAPLIIQRTYREISIEQDYDKTVDEAILLLEEIWTKLLKELDAALREHRINLSEYYQRQQILEVRLNSLDEFSIYRNFQKHMRRKDERRVK
ncbi:MAG: CHC2 zinc finger domain-containing protein [candidate division Zixibacteria bacterium]|nr:CHC2 zinc finger domain-containing protein [candidate division Zixibacteria bacterium]